ncbi:vancomycin high temperature exclusion protein [Algibacter miyuki]|uniref:Vancomycin high temperature exclusion protein n=1 Tax=Algibacter miyuki TaxID=1306933 RepID=A0ABV5GY41_9FLAO|nr:ElyC/SanA/YdcF family protein [Algibacter miyuki]MDN3665918.1 ElyC/SanA/YdcF family protein [Algibacter miyuki]
MKHVKRLLKLAFFILIYIVSINLWINHQAKSALYNNVSEIPKNKVGLILGAGKTTQYGNINLYYKYRLEAAIALFESGKIEYILISGDNSRKDYDEPTDFKIDLIENGIPENKIYLDYAGFRTLDSMVRAKEIFGLDAFTIISQKFHNERAIYLANQYDISAIAFNAKDVPKRYSFKTKLREYLARTKASVDILFNISPKFLGAKIEIK